MEHLQKCYRGTGKQSHRHRAPSDLRKKHRRAAERNEARRIVGDHARRLSQAEARAILAAKPDDKAGA